MVDDKAKKAAIKEGECSLRGIHIFIENFMI
jgi:hypothetical protein